MSKRSLFSSPQRKSIVWSVFNENAVDRSKADCTLCNQSISRGGVNAAAFTTSNLWSHLQVQHNDKFVSLKAEEKKSKEAAAAAVSPCTARQKTTQPSVADALQKGTKYAADTPRAKDITRLIMEMIALDDLPFEFVENVGFRRLLSFLDHR